MFKRFTYQQGITRLVTVIISASLIALTGGVIGIILHMGSSTGAQAQAEIDSALSQINNTLVLRGDIAAYNTPLNSDNSVGKIEFTVIGNGTAVDMTPTYLLDDGGALVPKEGAASQVHISYEDSTVSIPDCAWTVSFDDDSHDDYLLDGEEKAIITVWLQSWDGNTWYSGSSPFLDSDDLGGGQTFCLKVSSNNGVPLKLQLTTPYHLKPVNRLN